MQRYFTEDMYTHATPEANENSDSPPPESNGLQMEATTIISRENIYAHQPPEFKDSDVRDKNEGRQKLKQIEAQRQKSGSIARNKRKFIYIQI